MGHKRPRPERLGDKLREIRLAFELSQDLIRTRLGFGHIHPGRISEYETGKRVPPPMLLLAYADLAGVHVTAQRPRNPSSVAGMCLLVWVATRTRLVVTRHPKQFSWRN